MISQILWVGLELGVVYVLISLGLTLVFGVMKVVNFAHGELCMLGAMMVYTLMAFVKFPFTAAVICSMALVAAFGVIVNRLAIRPLIKASPVTIMLSTMALSFIIIYLGNFIWTNQARQIEAPFQETLQVAGITMSGQTIMLIVVGIVAVILLYLFLDKTQLGKLMRATSQDMTGARLVGINVNRIYDYTLIIASGLAALAGIFVMPVINAFPSMGQNLLPIAFAVVIV
ncbi:MAG: branched-chain amino acid ABC transporter permease [Dehalococcoidia bacterium]|nr:branched-chain amino acid ABC transporter permease [Dehalococcoidia bacterium]